MYHAFASIFWLTSKRRRAEDAPVACIPCATIKEARALVKAHASPRPRPAKKRKGWYYLKEREQITKDTQYHYSDGTWELSGRIGGRVRAFQVGRYRRPINRKDGR